MEKLAEVTERYHQIDDWELSEHTHGFKEWVDHFKGSASPIPWQDILVAQDRPDMVAVVERDEAAPRSSRMSSDLSHEGWRHLLYP